MTFEQWWALHDPYAAEHGSEPHDYGVSSLRDAWRAAGEIAAQAVEDAGGDNAHYHAEAIRKQFAQNTTEKP